MTSYAKRLAGLESAINGHIAATRTAQGTKAANSALVRAQHLAGMVREQGVDSIGPYLDALTPDELYALTVTLAAMVDLDRSPAELLAWLDDHQETAA